MYAIRNLKLCTKDCLCLFVCPTGATNTETGQIDACRCLDGCRLCVDACPSHAISLLPRNFAPDRVKDEEVVESLHQLLQSKVEQASVAQGAAGEEGALGLIARALVRSNLILAEDCAREMGYMVPHGENVRELLESIVAATEEDELPHQSAKKLLALL